MKRLNRGNYLAGAECLKLEAKSLKLKKKFNLFKSIFIIFALLFATLSFSASLSAKVDKRQIYRGDSVTLFLRASGENIKFPQINQIANTQVQSTGDSYKTIISNTTTTNIHTRTYTIAPMHNLTIPEFTVNIDGKDYKTKSIKISVIKPTASKNGAPYTLELKVDKSVAKVGEPIVLDIIFKQRRGTKMDKLNIQLPDTSNFWVKDLGGFKQSLEGNHIIQKKSFLIFPQKEGTFVIPATIAKVGIFQKRQNNFINGRIFAAFNGTMKWKEVFSSPAKIEVKPLPNNLNLYGDFNIQSMVDKSKVDANKPINLTIKIEGFGNIDDIEKFNIDIPNAVVYTNEPKIKTFIKNGKYRGIFKEKITIIANKSYVIPAIKFTYFDSKTNSVKTVHTKPIHITIKDNGAKIISQNQPKVEESKELQEAVRKSGIESDNSVQVVIKKDKKREWIYFIIGLVLGAILTALIFTLKPKKEKKESMPLAKQIKKAKDDKELYNTLLPYAKDDGFIKEVLEKLEENIYKNLHNKIKKNDIIDYFEELKGR